MACDICGRAACSPFCHPAAEREEYKDVLEAFEYARTLRAKVQADLKRIEERQGE